MNGEKIGRLTSGGYSVAFGKQIGMGYVRSDLAEVGHRSCRSGCCGSSGMPWWSRTAPMIRRTPASGSTAEIRGV